MNEPVPSAWLPDPEGSAGRERAHDGSARSMRPGTPGAVVGDYELLVKIGEGGMGVVHLARHVGGDRVALKVLRSHIVGDDEARARLAREVGSLSRIRSRWVAEIVDADPWAAVPFVATRYVPGLSLHDHVVEEGPVSGRDLLWFAGCLAEGLSSVHAVGVLHRDVKPSNVLMEGRTPILIDFGLARVADDPKLTHTGWLLGTPGYLAPEILYGDDATAASDVHSWAATVAYAATGSPPFGRGPTMAVMDRVRRGQHDLSGLTGDLRRVVAAALDPEPHRRPTLTELLAWLRPQSTRPHDPPVPAPVDADGGPGHLELTAPIGLVARGEAAAPTTPAPHTRILTAVGPLGADQGAHDAAAPWAGDERPGVWEPWVAPPASFAERSRRAVLLALLGAGVAAGLAAYPWLVLGLIGFVVWLVRSGSLAGSAADDRRRVRGPKWYDGPRLLLGAPWDLVRSLPGTVLLGLFAVGLAASVGLIVYLPLGALPPTLAAAGLALAGCTWWGPGSSRVRGPVRRVVRPLARTAGAWLVVALLLGAGTLGLAALAADGPDWRPVGQPPFGDAAVR